jgi:hypothetical protein
LHAFVVTVEGHWCVVQQGMNEDLKEARRYHWQSENLPGFFESPHSAVEGRNVGPIINLSDARAERNRLAELQLVQSGPTRTIEVLRYFASQKGRTADLFASPQPASPLPHLLLPHRHAVRASDVCLKRLQATLKAAADRGANDFADLLLIPGVGERTIAALAFVAEVIHGAPSRFSDPARFSLAHGGKDGHPFPVPLKVYDETIRLLKRAVQRAHLGSSEGLAAIKRLDAQARALELTAAGPSFAAFVARQRRESTALGGRTVTDETRGAGIDAVA